MNYKLITYNIFEDSWVEFYDVIEIVETSNINEVLEKFDYIQEKSFSINMYALGFVSYDAAPAFDPSLRVLTKESDIPLLWFAICSTCKKIKTPVSSSQNNNFSFWTSSVKKESYDQAIRKVKQNIFNGNTYQVNYTFRQNSTFTGNCLDLFANLAASQKSKTCTYIETDQFAICSISPELFFTYDKGELTSLPMKGTAKRGLNYFDDEKIFNALKSSEKNMAENVMIVDMIRNDFSKIALPNTVKVTDLFNIEKYPTVWQMTTKVSCKTKSNLTAILKAIFPCASITGAPKKSTMSIISETETTPRGLYTGAIGFIDPKNQESQFNVAIRTLVINKKNNQAEYGIGGGITWDSDTDEEYEECLLKAKVLSVTFPVFEILETILWEEGTGYFILEKHLNRMELSAKYFDYKFNKFEILEKLASLSQGFNSKKYKVRVLLSRDGIFSTTSEELKTVDKKYKVSISKEINTRTPFFLNKTTNRNHYDLIKKAHPNSDEVFILNEEGELTEGTFSNIVVKIDNVLYTPRIESGLLNGTFREYLLEKGEILERKLLPSDLNNASNIYLINSIRKYQECELITYH